MPQIFSSQVAMAVSKAYLSHAVAVVACRRLQLARQVFPPRDIAFLSRTPEITPRLFKTSNRLPSAIFAASDRGLSESSSLNLAALVSMDDCIAFAEDNPGIYAIYSTTEELQYIGMTKNIRTALERHRDKIPGQCVSVKALELPPDVSKAQLQQSWKVRNRISRLVHPSQLAYITLAWFSRKKLLACPHL